jgi:DNA-binding MarR family transcriptional regulator
MKTQATDAKLDVIANECLAMRLRLLNRVLTGLYNDALRPIGLKASQLNILVAAWKLGTANPLKVCDILHLDPSTLSRNVERMRSHGWLEVVPGDDARAQPFRLTPAGRGVLDKAIPKWNTAQQQAKRLLGDAAVDVLDKTVERLRRADLQS